MEQTSAIRLVLALPSGGGVPWGGSGGNENRAVVPSRLLSSHCKPGFRIVVFTVRLDSK